MYGIIMAGGSGTRFWPLSRQDTPKQLLPLWSGRTLLELTVERLRPLIPIERLLVVTGAHLAAATAAALPDLPAENLIVEPAARNTLPCVALGAAVVAAREPAAVLGIFSADHHVDDDEAFRAACRLGEDAARQGRIATLGIRPSRPETGFGYIRSAGGDESVQVVDSFVEKPDRATAERYVADPRYFWNAGIFFLSLDKLGAELERQRPAFHGHLRELERAVVARDPAALAQAFGALEATSVDYGIMEGAMNVVVIPARFRWSDVGHWGALDEVLPTDEAGNVRLGETVLADTRDAVLVNLAGDGRILAVVGVEGLVVVQTRDATLVLPKGQAQRVREIVSMLKEGGRGDLV